MEVGRKIRAPNKAKVVPKVEAARGTWRGEVSVSSFWVELLFSLCMTYVFVVCPWTGLRMDRIIWGDTNIQY